MSRSSWLRLASASCLVMACGGLSGCGLDALLELKQKGNAENSPSVSAEAAQSVGGAAGAAADAPAAGRPASSNDPAAALYGDQGGEQVLAAEQAPQDAPLRAGKQDSFFRLSNPRLGASRFGRPVLMVDYQRVFKGEKTGSQLLLKEQNGNVTQVLLMGPFWDNSGTLEIENRFGGGPFARPFPENLEIYLTRQDRRWGGKGFTFKVSTSTVLGTMPQQTLARNWTDDEIKKLTNPPPNHTNPNAHPNVGHDTAWAGDTSGGVEMRYVDPEKPLLGIEYRLGAWDNEKCFAQFVCVFDRDQEIAHQPRIIAKEGYAVGGFKVQTQKFVDAVKVVFMKLKPDGTLDPADSYESDWLGYPAEEGKTETLGGDGRAVIGLNCRQGAIINGIALVMKTSGVQ